MNEACSVVFVHSPFVVLFEGKELSLESDSALLVRGGSWIVIALFGMFSANKSQ